MTLCYTADSALEGQRVHLVTSSRAQVRTRIAEVTATPYDFVIESEADLPPESGGQHPLVAGSYAFAAPMTLTYPMLVNAGVEVYLDGLGWHNELTWASSTGLQVAGIVVMHALALNSGGRAIQMVGSTAHLLVNQCRLIGGASEVILISNAAEMNLENSELSSTGQGLRFNGGTVSRMTLVGCKFVVTGNVIEYTAGNSEAILMHGCQCDSNTGINWPSGSIPTEGLAVIGNHFDHASGAALAYAGHTPASARVNYKGNTESVPPGIGGLVTETAIVP